MTAPKISSRTTRNLLLTLCAAVGLVALFMVPGEAASGPAPAKANRYIGAKKCKSCHKSDASGNQYDIWEQGPHAKAFETLGSDAAKEAGAAMGIDDPQKADACLKCHTTGFGEPEDSFARGFKVEAGVQCESCHGPGEEHMKARFAAAAAADEGAVEAAYTGAAAGEMDVNPALATCTKCHNPGSPTYKSFCFYERRVKIRHLNPEKPRTEEEKAEMAQCPSGVPCAHTEGCPEGKCNLTPDELAKLKK
jgi:hypothetical protein